MDVCITAILTSFVLFIIHDKKEMEDK